MDQHTHDNLSSVFIPLKIAYGLVPIVAGLDKFFNLLTDWEKYLPSFLHEALPLSAPLLMQVVGIIEIVAGLLVLTTFTRLGANIVMAWLVIIAMNLIAAGYLDIAVRDLVMALGAYTLGQLAALRNEEWVPTVPRMRTA